MNKGIVYMATGDRYIEEAIISVTSLKQHLPDIPVTIFSDRAIGHPGFDREILLDNPQYNWSDKIAQMYASPYDYTLFIDTDTYICDDFSEIFALLDNFDLGVVHAPYRESHKLELPDSFPEMNTGVILFKKSPKVEQFFKNWTTIYQQHIEHRQEQQKREAFPDQPAFRQALYESPLRIATLPTEYNCRFIYPVSVDGKVKILHGRYPNLEFLAHEINSKLEPRIFAIDSKAWKFKIALHRLQKSLIAK